MTQRHPKPAHPVGTTSFPSQARLMQDHLSALLPERRRARRQNMTCWSLAWEPRTLMEVEYIATKTTRFNTRRLFQCFWRVPCVSAKFQGNPKRNPAFFLGPALYFNTSPPPPRPPRPPVPGAAAAAAPARAAPKCPAQAPLRTSAGLESPRKRLWQSALGFWQFPTTMGACVGLRPKGRKQSVGLCAPASR